MNFDEAMTFVLTCERFELRDHAFGDTEMTLVKDGKEIGGGYFSGVHADFWFNLEGDDSSFHEELARQLREATPIKNIDRNDITGPDEYEEGKTMPGLTKEAVRRELTSE